MSNLDFRRVKELLQGFRFSELLREELGWEPPPTRRGVPFDPEDPSRLAIPIAELGGVFFFEIEEDPLPEKAARKAIHTRLAQSSPEHVLIFLDRERTRSCWSWVRREDGKSHLRDHYFFRDQSPDAFIAKIASLAVDLSELSTDGRVELRQAAKKVRDALDVQPVVRKFYEGYKSLVDGFVDNAEWIEGIEDVNDRRWYASVLLNRLMFIYFLQRNRFLPGANLNYLQDKLNEFGDRFYGTFLNALFFDAFAKPKTQRRPETPALCGDVVYLNGGLFLPHRLEEDPRYRGRIRVSEAAFRRVLSLFGAYEWTFAGVPENPAGEINPDILGYIFEKYINQKEFGAYYTPSEMTAYLVQQTVEQILLDKGSALTNRKYETVYDMINRADAKLLRGILDDALRNISLLDPACGSGAFLYAALRAMHDLYFAALGRVDALRDEGLRLWKEDFERDHPNLGYAVDKRIITDNLYGVDIMEEATEIAKLRLFMALVGNVPPGQVEDLEPLPNIDFNIMAGNSLVGLMRVEEATFNGRLAGGGKKNSEDVDMFAAAFGYADLVLEKNRLTHRFRHPREGDDVGVIRHQIDELSDGKFDATGGKLEPGARDVMNEMLLSACNTHKIQRERAVWDVAKGKEGKPIREALTLADLRELQPFHWGFEFNEILTHRNGFDAIITNPPWETVKPQDKEFFARYSQEVHKNKMDIKAFQAHKAEALASDPVLRKEYEAYLSRFPHQSAFFRSPIAFNHQRAQVNGKWTGTDLNLYKLFTERCFELLRPGGYAGMIVPTNLMKDLGSFGLRKMLFEGASVTGVVGLSNERFLFEGVHHSFHLCILSFRRGRDLSDRTQSIETVFRINPREAIGREELGGFLTDRGNRLGISLELIQRLSPDAWALMEFRNETDVQIAKNLAQFSMLGQQLDSTWNLRLGNEFHMTNDSGLFKAKPDEGDAVLVQGAMINQFTFDAARTKYWLNRDNAIGRLAVKVRSGMLEGHIDTFRLAHRRIARNADSRTMIATIVKPNHVCGDTAQVVTQPKDPATLFYLTAIFNSLVFDFQIRQRVTTHCDAHHVYGIRVPRLTAADPSFKLIVDRSARLICTEPGYDDLARQVGLQGCEDGAIAPEERLKLRAELDALIARLYGLTEKELVHIMATFPLVTEAAKDATLAEFQRQAAEAAAIAADPLYAELLRDLANHEDHNLEFKATLTFPSVPKEIRDTKRDEVLREIVAFLNAQGGRIYIGIHDKSRAILGIEKDYPAIGAHNWDDFERHLDSLIEPSRFAPLPLHRYHAKPVQTPQGLVCRIDVDPAPDEIWFYRNHIVVRQDGGARQLLGKQGDVWAVKRRQGLV